MVCLRTTLNLVSLLDGWLNGLNTNFKTSKQSFTSTELLDQSQKGISTASVEENKDDPQSEDDPKYEDNPTNENNLKSQEKPKNEHNSKNEEDPENEDYP